MSEITSFLSVAIELTSHCNQRCAHCYNAWRGDDGAQVGELTFDVLANIVHLLSKQARIGYIVLTGGEPLLRTDIHRIIDAVRSRGMGVAIVSNGGLVTAEVARRLQQQGVLNDQITLTGADAETHDAFCGRESFAGAIRAIDLLRAADVDLAGSFLCTSENYRQAGDVLALFAARGVSKVAFNRFSPAGESRHAIRSLLPTRSQVLQALFMADEKAREHVLDVSCTMPVPPCVVDWEQYPRVRFGFCSAGTEKAQLVIGPDGLVRMCALQRKPIGSLLEEPLEALLASEEVLRFRRAVPEFCEECSCAATCLGGCGAAAEWAFGSPAELDPFVAQHVLPDYLRRLGGGGAL